MLDEMADRCELAALRRPEEGGSRASFREWRERRAPDARLIARVSARRPRALAANHPSWAISFFILMAGATVVR
jgi:hypothetical protein